MRHLYIIGNGFDLAHGLETSYHHFLIWFLNDTWNEILNNQEDLNKLENRLLKAQRGKCMSKISFEEDSKIENINDFKTKIISLNTASRSPIEIIYSPLIQEILDQSEKNGWADIEKAYYLKLVETLLNKQTYYPVLELNKDLEYLKLKLICYLKNNVLNKIDSNTYNINYEDIINKEEYINEYKLFINFNYTTTFLKKYINKVKGDKGIIHIHGTLNNESNPIIFGYGDEMDINFKKLEDEDDNQYLENLKSFGYFQTENYKRILDFLHSSDNFRVHIVGHSLGLSDRLLLNTIFESDNCKEIEVHYSRKMNDYNKLIRNLSRHFNYEMKGSMRQKVVPFLKTYPMD